MICCFCAGHHVHEEQTAGKFMPGSAQCPIKNLPEKDLKLLDTRSDADGELPPTLADPPAPETPVAPVAPVPPVVERPVVEQPAAEVAAVAELPRVPSPPPSPSVSSMVSKTSTSKSKSSSKYAKYHDGSYWKILV